MLFAHWMLLVASLLPIVAAGVAKTSQRGYDNHNPRDFLENLPQKSLGKRMVAAQGNSWEALMMFAPAVLLASMRGVNADTLNMLAGVFVVARLIYVWCYAKDLATARTLAWTVGLLAVIGLYIAAQAA